MHVSTSPLKTTQNCKSMFPVKDSIGFLKTSSAAVLKPMSADKIWFDILLFCLFEDICQT